MLENQKKNYFNFIILGTVISMLLIIIILLLVLCNKKTEVKESSNIVLNAEQDSNKKVESSQDMVYFTGFDNLVVNQDEVIILGCDNGNRKANIAMSYQIYDSDNNLIYDSNLILPGKEIPWVPSDYLEKGEHDIVFHEQPYQIIDLNKEIDETNVKKLYFVDQKIKITIN